MRSTERFRGGGGERGSIVLLGLGAVLVLLVVGALAIDLWRAFATRQALAARADAAAAAGANAVDPVRYRNDGAIVLDPELALALASDMLADQPAGGPPIGLHSIETSPELVVVVLEGEVPLTLLGLVPGGRALDIRVTAEAAPRRGG